MEIKIWDDYSRQITCIIFMAKIPNEKTILHNFMNNEEKVIGEMEEIPNEFILKIPHHFTDSFLISLCKELDGKGIKTENHHKLEGILESTKYHLEDMRKLVFKDGD